MIHPAAVRCLNAVLFAQADQISRQQVHLRLPLLLDILSGRRHIIKRRAEYTLPLPLQILLCDLNAAGTGHLCRLSVNHPVQLPGMPAQLPGSVAVPDDGRRQILRKIRAVLQPHIPFHILRYPVRDSCPFKQICHRLDPGCVRHLIARFSETDQTQTGIILHFMIHHTDRHPGDTIDHPIPAVNLSQSLLAADSVHQRQQDGVFPHHTSQLSDRFFHLGTFDDHHHQIHRLMRFLRIHHLETISHPVDRGSLRLQPLFPAAARDHHKILMAQSLLQSRSEIGTDRTKTDHCRSANFHIEPPIYILSFFKQRIKNKKYCNTTIIYRIFVVNMPSHFAENFLSHIRFPVRFPALFRPDSGSYLLRLLPWPPGKWPPGHPG